ncbi:MAG TPA: hypothetical protein VLM91_06230 [Candidatus Methylomirabilis sp.]|nr:hypothetical protein [Candidatus Methylomirabilis sp.]
MTGAKRGGGDFARLVAFLAEAGLTMPPIPESAQPRLKEREEWCFSSRAFKVSPHRIQHYVRKGIEGSSPDYVLIARSGQGAIACAMHYFLVQAPLQLFLQISLDGPCPVRTHSAVLVNECFALAHQLVEAIPEALRRGRLPRDGRLTVVASDLNESFWEAVAGGERAGGSWRPSRRPPRTRLNPWEVLQEASRWCGGKT